MKTLSVQQPWAHLIVHGKKDVENRTWSTRYRGPLLIHASKRIDNAGMPRFWELGFHSMRMRFGGIIGVVDLVDVVRDSQSPWALPGQYHWLLSFPRPLSYIEVRGKLGLWSFEHPDAPDVEIQAPTMHRAQITLDL